MEDWEPVTLGRSGDGVWRSPDGAAYAKQGDVGDECDRLLWLASIGFPAPRVLDFEESTSTLVMTAIPGVPLSALPAGSAAGGLAAGLSMLRSLHDIPVGDCPFDARLEVAVLLAQKNVADGLVDEGDFDVVRRGASASRLLTELLADVPRASELEATDLVVTHGDACLPNLIVDPDTLRPTGILDVGRLGTADRHQDLALLTRSAGDAALNPAFASLVVDDPMDPWRLEFYRLLDEFF